MKRLLALFLCLVCALAAAPALAEEPLSFTMTSCASLTGEYADYKEDSLYKYVADKFNIDVDIWASGWDVCWEKDNMWITNGTMPDVMFWSTYNLADYLYYANQGFFKPLPENWEERWPNLAQMNKSTGASDLLNVDGADYAFAHAVFGNYLEVSPFVYNISMYYRADWAEQAGLTELGQNGGMTIDELKDYLLNIKEAGLTENAYIGTKTQSDLVQLFMQAQGVPYGGETFIETEDGFEWLFTMDGVTEAIQNMQDWYNAGLIAPDIYNTDVSYESKFKAGLMAGFYEGAAPMLADGIKDAYVEGNPEGNRDDVNVATVTANDGTAYSVESLNMWGVTVFNPTIDDAKMERILDLCDWVASKDGLITTINGTPGEQWEYDENGNVVFLENAPERKFPSLFKMLGYCDDDFSYSGYMKGVEQDAIDVSKSVLAVKQQGVIFPFSDNYALYQSETKDNYSTGAVQKIIEIVCDNLDVESSWNQYVEETRTTWEPLLNELNETYYGK